MTNFVGYTKVGIFSGHRPWLQIRGPVQFSVMPWHDRGMYSYVLVDDLARFAEHLNCVDFRKYNPYPWLDDYYNKVFVNIVVEDEDVYYCTTLNFNLRKAVCINELIPNYQI